MWCLSITPCLDISRGLQQYYSEPSVSPAAAGAPPAGWMKGLGHLDHDVIRAGVVVKRAVSATVWKNWRPRYVVLRMGCIEWHKVTGLEDEVAETEDLPAGLMRLRPNTECCAGGERAHCLTMCTSGRVLQLNPDTLALTRNLPGTLARPWPSDLDPDPYPHPN